MAALQMNYQFQKLWALSFKILRPPPIWSALGRHSQDLPLEVCSCPYIVVDSTLSKRRWRRWGTKDGNGRPQAWWGRKPTCWRNPGWMQFGAFWRERKKEYVMVMVMWCVHLRSYNVNISLHVVANGFECAYKKILQRVSHGICHQTKVFTSFSSCKSAWPNFSRSSVGLVGHTAFSPCMVSALNQVLRQAPNQGQPPPHHS